jgi:zinc protease
MTRRTRLAPAVALAVLCALPVVVAAQSNPEQFRAWPTERPPAPLPAKPVTFPHFEVRAIDNGLQVVTVLQHEQPAVTMRLIVRAGAAQDPQGLGGLAGLAANLLDQGTATRSAFEIADQIDSIGGAMGTGSGTDLTFVNAVVMKDSFERAMDLLADVVRHPAFAPDEIDRQKERAISSQQVSGQDPGYVASVVLDRLVFGFHPYGLPGSGTPQSLAAIARRDLQEFHRRYFVPNNMVLAIVGDVTREEAYAAAERVFGSMPRGDIDPPRTAEPPEPTRRVVVIDKPDSVQTAIRIGQIGIPRRHPDHLAFDLAVKILGGEGANRLHGVLRSQRGLTYGASAQAFALKQAGSLVAETDTQTENTLEVLQLMLGEFVRIQRDRVGMRELADAQAYLAGSFPLTIETPNDIATHVLNAVFYELPIDELSAFRERVLAITPDDIQRAARQYIRPERLSIVLVGDAGAFVPQLRAAGLTTLEIIPIEQLDLMAPSLRRAGRPAAAALRGPVERWAGAGPRAAYAPDGGAPAALAQREDDPRDEAHALLQRVIEAKGGSAALAGIETIIADADTVLRVEAQEVVSTTRTYIRYPDRYRVDASVDGIEVVQIFSQGSAWVKDPAGVRSAPPAMRDDFGASVRRDTIALLLAADAGRYTVRQLPVSAGAEAVLEVSGLDLDPVRLYLDAEWRITRQTYTTPGPEGRIVQVEEILSDYRDVDGIRVPFRAQLVRDGRPVLTRTLTRVTLNAPIDDTLFTRPR